MSNILYTLDDILEAVEKETGLKVKKPSSYSTFRLLKIKPDKIAGKRGNLCYYSESKKEAVVSYYSLYFERRDLSKKLRESRVKVSFHTKQCRSIFGNEENKGW